MEKQNIIEPKILKGFKDFLPKEKRMREKVVEIMKKTFEKYGFGPLETVDLEYYDVLMGKYGEDEKLIYSFEDKGGRKVGLRYDLTVPTARVIAQYQNEITLPFKRYQIQKVWRADKPQKGRMREFYQCDADTFGSDDMVTDAEYIMMSIETLKNLGFKDFKIKLNNRKILDALFQFSKAKDGFISYISALDKLDKIGIEGVSKEMEERGFNQEVIENTKKVIAISGTNIEKLKTLQNLLGENGTEGISELLQILQILKGTDAENYVEITLPLARGLSYYTGPIWELDIKDGDVGSVGGGGRYDKLVGSFLGRNIPATGGTWGLERIIQVMMDRNMLNDETGQNIDVLVTMFSEDYKKKSFDTAKSLRDLGLSVLLYPQEEKLGKQFKYADQNEIPWVIIIGEDEMKENLVTLKNMKTGEQEKIKIEDVVRKVK
jgi:histidyl-tRNA synthetase